MGTSWDVLTTLVEVLIQGISSKGQKFIIVNLPDAPYVQTAPATHPDDLEPSPLHGCRAGFSPSDQARCHLQSPADAERTAHRGLRGGSPRSEERRVGKEGPGRG